MGRLEALVTPTLEGMGYELVRVSLTGTQRPVLQIMADRADETPMTVEDCAKISRAISALLDVEDPIESAYTLEVSTPGIDRPLTREKDFVRFAGHEAKIELAVAQDGRKRFRGILKGVEDGLIVLEDEKGGVVSLPFADLRTAKLILTDALLAASAAQLEANAAAQDEAEEGEGELDFDEDYDDDEDDSEFDEDDHGDLRS